MAPNFQNGKVYCLRVSTQGDRIVYVGSTVRPLSERMAEHRKHSKSKPDLKLYKFLNDVGMDNVYIELLCAFPCNNREALHAEEGRHMRIHRTVIEGGNKNVAGRTQKESEVAWRAANRDKIAASTKAWATANHEVRTAQNRAWKAAHRDVINQRQREIYAARRAAVAPEPAADAE